MLSCDGPGGECRINMEATGQRIRRAKARLFGTEAAEIAVPFELSCQCGGVLRGVRRTGWQQSACDQCGTSRYVLPVNVYPATVSVHSEVVSGSFFTRLMSAVSEVAPVRKSNDSAPGSIRPKKKAKSSAADSAEPSVERKSRFRLRLPQFSLPRPDVSGFLRRTFTPFRLLMMAMACIVVATGGWMIHQRRIETARQTWRTSVDQLTDLLENNDLPQLQPVLKDAVSAGTILGKNDREFRVVTNLYEETLACESISNTELLQTLRDTYSADGQLKPDAGKTLLSALSTGCFVFDTLITSVGNNRPLAVDLPFFTADHAVRVSIDLPDLHNVLEQSTNGRVIFAAHFQSVDVPVGDHGNWHLTLNPETFVLITSEVHCRDIGILADDDDAVAAVLENQRNFVEESETWLHRRDRISGDGLRQ